MSLQRAEFEGISLGEPGQPIQPTVEFFRQKGVAISRATASTLRRIRAIGEPQNGNEVRDRLLCAKRLSDNSAAQKDLYYLLIAQTGVGLNTDPDHPTKRQLSFNFTESIAKDLDLSRNYIRSSMRAMRTDLTYMEQSHLLDEDIVRCFVRSAGDFIESYTTPPSKARPSVLRIKESWDAHSIAGFYSCFYNNASAHRGETIGVWTRWEVEVMEAFYQAQVAKRDPLTPLDMLTLQSYSQGKFQTELAQKVRRESLIDIDRWVMVSHRNALIYGRPFNPSRVIQ